MKRQNQKIFVIYPLLNLDFEEIFEINHLGTPLLNGKKIFENPLIAFQKIIDKWKIKNNDLAAIGYISYDLKNEIEGLNSLNNDRILSNNLSFFIPKYVLLLKKGVLEVLTYESKHNVDLLLQDYNSLLLSKQNKINLIQRETNE